MLVRNNWERKRFTIVQPYCVISSLNVFLDGSHDSSYPVISAGDHAFPFHFEIPMSHLPSSFEGKLGCIRYTLKAIMDRPWKSNYSSKSAITILEMVDINEPWALVRVKKGLNNNVHANIIDISRVYVRSKYTFINNAKCIFYTSIGTHYNGARNARTIHVL